MGKTAQQPWAARVGLLVLVGVLVVQCADLAARAPWRVDDFAAFWGLGRTILEGRNPYATPGVPLPQELRHNGDDVLLMMGNPPTTFTLLLPFCLLPYGTARMLWLLLNVVLLIACADYLWRFYGGAPARRGLAWVAACAFAPSLFLLQVSQISVLVLVGVLLFLAGARRERWVLAGSALALTTIKPQAVFLFWAILPLWAAHRRRPAVAVGCLAGTLALLLVPLWLDPAVLDQYWHLMRGSPNLNCITATWGDVLRLLFGPEKVWLQFVPVPLGLAWAGSYWWRRRAAWDWGAEMPLVLLMTAVTSPHLWPFDEVLLVPAVMQAGVWASHAGGTVQRRAVLAYVGINLLALMVNQLNLQAVWQVWFAPALLALFCWVRQTAAESGGQR